MSLTITYTTIDAPITLGENGRSAYESYLTLTTDDPVLTEAAWSTPGGGDVSTSAVTTAGALMDSEVTNLAAVKAFDPAAYADASHTHLLADVTDADTAAQTLTNKTLDDFSNQISADKIREEVRNGTGVTLTAGTPVYEVDYNFGLDLPNVAAASAASAATLPAIGVVEYDIPDNSSGSVVEAGPVGNIDTSLLVEGQVAYVSATTGELTSTKPTGTAGIQKIVFVLRSHASLGVVDVIGSGTTSEIPNFSSANQFWYGDGTGTTTEATITAAGRALLDDADAAAQRTTLGLPVVGNIALTT